MPELPDVEYFKQYAQATSLHKTISEVDLASERLLESTSRQSLLRTLHGTELEEGSRHGKHLFLPLSSGKVLMLHFGMTGYLESYKHGGDPEYAQLALHFEDGYSLAYVCTRMLGKIAVADSMETYIEEKGLGPDALSVTAGQLEEIVGGGRGAIKSTLMNQSRIAGLGNIYSDEVLFQCGIDPRRPCSKLSVHELRSMRKAIHSVTDAAVKAHALPDKMPKTFLIRYRSPGSRCPKCGGTVTKITLSGRSTYLCERCQQ